MTQNRLKFLPALIAGLVLVLAGLGRAEVVDRIVATVNGDIITLSELKNMAKSYEAQTGVKPTSQENKAIQRQMLEALINRKLAKEEAKRRGITLSEKELNQALDRFKQRNHIIDDEALTKALSQAGMTMSELKQQISDQIIQERLVMATLGNKIVVRDADVRKFYEEEFKKGGEGEELHLVIVKLPYPSGSTEAQKAEIQQKAETVVKEAGQGATFLEIANKLSLDATDLGYVAVRDIDRNLAEHLAKAKTREVVPVQTPGGFQLFQVMSRRHGGSRPFEEVAPEIKSMLMQKEMAKHFEEWVKGLREKAHIEIML